MIDARFATEADAAALDLLRSAAREAVIEQRGGASYLDTTETGGCETVVGTVDGTVVGFGDVRIDGERATLATLFVDPRAREIGVGDAILQFVQSHSRTSGARHLDAFALPGDRDTKNFFESHAMKSRVLVVHTEL